MDDKCSQLGAALAFYSILSLAPLLVVAIAVAGLVFGQEAARGELASQMESTVGSEGAKAVQSVLKHAQQPTAGSLAAVFGIVMLLVGASGVFGQLQSAMNTIWEVEPKSGGGIWAFIKSHFLSFTLVLGTGFLLLISLVLSAVIAGASEYLSGVWPHLEPLWHLANALVSFVVVMLLFAMIFRFLPDTSVAWRDVWVGAAMTAVLFTLGKFLIGLYLGKSSVGSAYGAAGSLVVLLIWIYYSAQILFFGAELTQVYAKRHGSWATAAKPKPGNRPSAATAAPPAPGGATPAR